MTVLTQHEAQLAIDCARAYLDPEMVRKFGITSHNLAWAIDEADQGEGGFTIGCALGLDNLHYDHNEEIHRRLERINWDAFYASYTNLRGQE